MDTVLSQTPDQAVPPVEAANQSVPGSDQHDVQAQANQPHLEQQGEQQAPAPTSGGETSVGTSAEEQRVSFEEFQRLQQERGDFQKRLQEQDQLISQIQRLADEQKALEAQQALRGEIQGEIADLLRKAGADDDDLASAITAAMYGRIDSTRTQYQSQMTQYQEQVDDYARNAIWTATRDGFADHIIREYKLDPVVRQRLLTANSDEEMQSIADTLREAQQFYQRQAYDRTVQEQEAQRRASGVDTITGTTSGPTVNDLKPGRNLDVLGAILAGTSR